MKSTIVTVLLFAQYLFAACTTSGIDNKLVHAHSLAAHSPDSALSFLQSIQLEELKSPKDQAYYILLLTQAQDNNYIYQNNDTLIRIAVQYYDSTKETSMQAKAHYYLGCIQRNKSNYSQALKELFTAIIYAEKCADYKLAGYSYNNIANLYYLQKLNEEADSIYQIAKTLAIHEKDPNLLAEVLSQQGMIDIRKGKEYYLQAEKKLLYAFKIAQHTAQKNIIAKTAYSLSLLYGRMNMGEKAVVFAKLNVSHQNNYHMLCRAYLILGDAYYKTSQYDSASNYLSKALYSEDNLTKAGVYMRLADIDKKLGKLDSALEMERKYSYHLDNARQKQQGSAIIQIEKNMLTKRKALEHKTNLNQLYSDIITGMVIGLSLFLALWNKFKKETLHFKQKEVELNERLKKQLQQKNKQINLLQEEIAQQNHKQEERQILQEELHALNNERQALLKEAYEHSEVFVKMRRIIQSYKRTEQSNELFEEADWMQLIAETDIRWNNITIRLTTQYPLSQDEIYLCCLYLTDIPTSHFRYIMVCSRDAIYKKTKRIVEQKMKHYDKMTSLRNILESFL